ncbi:MAG TPA: mechanosensitive ion channel family protein [Bdellovibrionota bacterium]|nr:mechanosensitive ion channel family protein [Bdellovibrionota bacterium]
MTVWIWPVLLTLAAFFSLWIAKRLLFRLLRRWGGNESPELAHQMMHVLSGPANVVVAVISLSVGSQFAPLPPRLEHLLPQIVKILLVVIGIYLADRIALLLYRRRQSKGSFLRISSSIVQAILHSLIYGVGGLIVLDSLGISITPLLASLGIGSLAVALALQDTLANVFSGIYLSIEQPMEVGHFVRLESGEEGYVEKIGWRSTRIRMLPNNTVIVPNTKLAGSHFTNYYLPSKDLAVLVNLGIHYDSDLKHVERITVEVAKETMRDVNGGVPEFEPFIRYHTFADSSINFTVILRAQEFVDQYLVKHEFIKRLHERYRKERIIIPFPIRTLEFPPSFPRSVKLKG